MHNKGNLACLMSSVFLSVIVCTKNRADELECCLPLVIEQANAFSDVELVVVDNGSVDNTKNTVKRISKEHNFRILYAYEPVAGLCQARNRGRKEAHGKVLAYIDDDVRIKDRWVQNIRKHFLERRSDCLGGKVTVRLGGEVPIKGAQQMLWFFGETDLGIESREYMGTDRIQYPAGCNMAFKADVFDAVGGFDTSLKYYFDETEFFRRVGRYDFKVLYVHDVEVEQFIPVARLTKDELRRKTNLLGNGAAIFWNLSNPGVVPWAKRFGICTLKSVYHLLSYIINPTFGKFFAFWFNYGWIRQLLKFRFAKYRDRLE